MGETSLSRDIYDALSARILRFEYPPGHRLTEEALCAEFRVSRSPVREVLGVLVENGLVDKKAGQGYSVRKIDLREIHELYDARLVIERAIIEKLCAEGLEPEELARLESYWRGLLAALPAMAENLAGADEEFHEVLAKAAGNRVLQQMLRYVDTRIHFVRLADITNPERLRTTCTDHLAILEAIREHDAAKAAGALRRNIEWGRANVEAALKEALIRAHQLR